MTGSDFKQVKANDHGARKGQGVALSNWRYLFILLWIGGALWAQTAEVVKVKLQGDETLRTLAKKYFDEPNDWEIILRYNNLNSPSEVSSSTVLTIPVKLYASVMQKTTSVLKTIDEANREGANILAREDVVQAISLQKQSTELKKNGQLEQADKTLSEALLSARKALQTARDKRVRAISALLTQKKGKVQSKSQEQTVWFDAEKDQELKEKERIRTLENSGGEISLVDGSRLNLGANALAVIEAMKQDVVKNTQTSNVVLLQGDVLAYLSAQSKKNAVNVSTPGVETDIRSRNFRATRDEKNTSRFANYDGEIDVKASGASVTIKQNEGTVIAEGQKPSRPKSLLPAPQIVIPTDGSKYFRAYLDCQWKKVENAVAYRVEIAGNHNFSPLIATVDVRGQETWRWEAPGNGIYFLRIESVDKENLVGPSTEPVEFYIEVDNTPPFLSIETPRDFETTFTGLVRVSGQSENKARVLIDGDSVQVGKDGRFSTEIKIKSETHRLLIKAIDQAGNVSQNIKTINYNIGDQLVFPETPDQLTVNQNEVTIFGRTKPMTSIEINSQPVQISDNRFRHLLNLPEGLHQVVLKARSGAKTQQLTFEVRIDKTAPVLELAEFPPFTKEKELTISGTLSEAGEVVVNSQHLTVDKTSFSTELELGEGRNRFVMTATDLAGNQTGTELEIIRDTTIPEVLATKLSHQEVKGGELVRLNIQARDLGVGLARNGKFILELNPGARPFIGMLSLTSAGGEYIGNVLIPPGVKGTLKVREIRISDYLGNEAVVNK